MASPNKNAGDIPTLGPRKKPSVAVFMFTTIVDTTWRMFVPTVGLTYLGWLGDKQWGTKPWLLATGVIIGSSISAMLVFRQLKSENKS